MAAVDVKISNWQQPAANGVKTTGVGKEKKRCMNKSVYLII